MRGEKVLRGLLLLAVLIAAGPVAFLLLGGLLTLVGNVAVGVGFRAEALGLVLANAGCAALMVLSVLRLARRTCAWGIWMAAGMMAAGGSLLLLLLANENVEYDMAAVPLAASAALLMLNGLWSICEWRLRKQQMKG